jgi:hypothetical protein
MKIQSDLVSFLLEKSRTNDEIKKHCDEFVKLKQHEMMLNPKVYFVIVKSHGGNEKYFNVRCFLPISLTETKELRCYVGNVKDFPNGVQDKTALKIGQDVMRKRIKRFIDEKIGITE